MTAVLEFVAYYQANRIDRVVFYDQDTKNADVIKLINSIPFAILVNFTLPINAKKIHANGQVAAQQDCLLRNIFKTIIFVDVDEFIVTRAEPDLKSYIWRKSHDSSLAAVVVPNVFVCNQYEPLQPRFPAILDKTRRQTFRWFYGDRCKMILLRPARVERLGIHIVWRLEDTYQHLFDEEGLMLFHYRSCCFVWQRFATLLGFGLYFKTKHDQTVEDQSIRRYKDDIMQFVRAYVDLQ